MNFVYKLNYGQDAHRTEDGDITYFSTLEKLHIKLKELLDEDEGITDIREASSNRTSYDCIEDLNPNNNMGQFELSNGSNSVFFEIDYLNIYE